MAFLPQTSNTGKSLAKPATPTCRHVIEMKKNIDWGSCAMTQACPHLACPIALSLSSCARNRYVPDRPLLQPIPPAEVHPQAE